MIKVLIQLDKVPDESVLQGLRHDCTVQYVVVAGVDDVTTGSHHMETQECHRGVVRVEKHVRVRAETGSEYC